MKPKASGKGYSSIALSPRKRGEDIVSSGFNIMLTMKKRKKRKEFLTIRGHVKDIGSAGGIQYYRGHGYEGTIVGR